MVKDIYGGNHSFLVLHDLADSELLDPQYDEYPADISKEISDIILSQSH
jgi:hypothetical protein